MKKYYQIRGVIRCWWKLENTKGGLLCSSFHKWVYSSVPNILISVRSSKKVAQSNLQTNILRLISSKLEGDRKKLKMKWSSVPLPGEGAEGKPGCSPAPKKTPWILYMHGSSHLLIRFSLSYNKSLQDIACRRRNNTDSQLWN